MARYRRMSSSLHPINRIKHIVDSAQTLGTGAGTLALTLIEAKDAPVIANTAEVQTASKVNGIFLNVQSTTNQESAGAIPTVYIAVYKDAGGLTPTIDPRTTGDDPNKKFIIHQEMSMGENSATGTPRTIFKGVIVIPKGMRRFGANDKLILAVRPFALNITICSQCIYKEFR